MANADDSDSSSAAAPAVSAMEKLAADIRAKIKAGQAAERARHLNAGKLLLEASEHFDMAGPGFARWYAKQGFTLPYDKALQLMLLAKAR